MFKPPSGRHLTSAQATDLDDSYFQSRPFGYFSSRIASLLASSQLSETDPNGSIASGLASALGQPSLTDVLQFDKSDRELQLATDAFTLRHHAAEALVRLYHALTIGVKRQDPIPCVWNALAEGPTKTIDLVTEAKAHLLSTDGSDSFWTMVFPRNFATQNNLQEEANRALNVAGDWLTYAMTLLVRNDLNINAAHNKVKHGLAIRGRDNLRLTLTTQPPNPDGTVPLASLTGDGAMDIFDSITLDFLARPPTKNKKKQGLEVSTLKLVPTTLLAEAWLMSVIHAAMFHIAAAEHFQARDVSIQPFPKLPLGPTPQQLLKGCVVGMRHPITTPPDGSPLERGTGIAFQEMFVPILINFDEMTFGKVVD